MSNPTHLLSSLGVLASFSIAKQVSKEEITKISNKIKKQYKEIDDKKFQKLLKDALIQSTKKYVNSMVPPGLIFIEMDPKKQKLDEFYMKLQAISQALANKLSEEKMTKHQICFIVNALITIMGVKEEDFEEFHRKFSKYKEGDFSDDE
jgi:hypothetical protein